MRGPKGEQLTFWCSVRVRGKPRRCTLELPAAHVTINQQPLPHMQCKASLMPNNQI